MNQLEYLPGIAGQSVQLDGPSAFVGIAEEMRSREWDYDLGYRDLVTATRPARTVDVTFNADYGTADTLRRVADADVMARTPGTFVAQKEWKQRGYILASDVDDIHYGRLSTGLKIALLDGAWWRLVKRSFVPEITTPEYRSATGETVTASGASGAPLHALTVDGESVQDGTPTPDAPVDVQVVEGANLIDWSDMPTRTNYGVTWSPSADGWVYASGTATSTSYAQAAPTVSTLALGMVAYCKPGTYTAHGDGIPFNVFSMDSTASGVAIRGYSTDAFTFTLTEARYIQLGLRVPNGTVTNKTYKVQLVRGTSVKPYVPYGSIGLVVGDAATSIDLQGNVLASLPDGTKDVLTVDSVGHCVLEKRVEVLHFDGSSSTGWSGNTASGYAYYQYATYPNATPYVLLTANNVMCNEFARQGSVPAGIGISNTNARIRVRYDNSTTADLSAFMTWLTTHPLTILVPKQSQETIDLGYIDMPAIPLDAQISVTAQVTPTITAEWQISRDAYLDYPHDYPYDYQKTSSTESITPSVLTPSDVRLVIYGPAVNPYVIVGGNRYQVNVTVPSGGYLTVDGRDKTIQLTLADGTVQNVFSSGVRGGGAGGGSYIFERVPAGTSEVTYDGSFGFDLGWYEEEGEPPWSQS